MGRLKGKTKQKARKARIQHKQVIRARRNNDLSSSIKVFDDPVLKKMCFDVEKDENLDFVRDIAKVLLATKTGVGLAAPQIGILKRAFVFFPNSSLRIWKAMINPVLISHSDAVVTSHEHCLSYPGICGNIERFKTVLVRYTDIGRKTITQEFKGLGSRVVQHEMNHLDGLCAVSEFYYPKTPIGN